MRPKTRFCSDSLCLTKSHWLVEINVAIMVASMSACASFYRNFSPQISISLSIRSPFNKSKSNKGHSSPKQPVIEMGSSNAVTSRVASGNTSNGKYWRLKNVLARGDTAPQITFNQNQSRIIRTNEFDVYDESKVSLERHPALLARVGASFEPHDAVSMSFAGMSVLLFFLSRNWVALVSYYAGVFSVGIPICTALEPLRGYVCGVESRFIGSMASYGTIHDRQ